CRPGPAPLVQSRLLVPPLAARLPPCTSKYDTAPSGMPMGRSTVPFPPPNWRQPSPRSVIFVAPPVSESSSPENGGAGGEVRPLAPQFAVPGVMVIARRGCARACAPARRTASAPHDASTLATVASRRGQPFPLVLIAESRVMCVSFEDACLPRWPPLRQGGIWSAR